MNSVAAIVSLITVGATLIAIVTFVLTNARTEANKRSRIYGRIDEVREDTNNTYVRQDICKVQTGVIVRDIGEIKTDVKEIKGLIIKFNGRRKRR